MVSRRHWLATATARLIEAGCEDTAFDARCLLEDFGGLPRGHAADETPLTEAQATLLDNALAQREAGRPLQYILGEWEFLTLTLKVGEGVLIPRPDTELLCEVAAAHLRGIPAPRVLDLCAGSGCVGLGLASLCPAAQVTAVELSEGALPYLRDNASRYPNYAVTVRQADVLTDYAAFDGPYDAILSNPPYIPTNHLPFLQREVQHEPKMALDGDTDGLTFYRTIAEHWCEKLAPDGFCAVEVGIGQAEDVAALFAAQGLETTAIYPDLAGIPRVVLARK
ncbi:MAG: peptide chain release factor N(5)-glutamine methyltransferase [Clostridia bacterium]|nr:peptide chain release factor N(5)-glutamine methyltransferase [Clostridia bacterium]